MVREVVIRRQRDQQRAVVPGGNGAVTAMTILHPFALTPVSTRSPICAARCTCSPHSSTTSSTPGPACAPNTLTSDNGGRSGALVITGPIPRPGHDDHDLVCEATGHGLTVEEAKAITRQHLECPATTPGSAGSRPPHGAAHRRRRARSSAQLLRLLNKQGAPASVNLAGSPLRSSQTGRPDANHHPHEVALAEKIAASARQLLTLLADLDDPETLLEKATRLDCAGSALYLEVLDTSDLPITARP